MNTAKVTIVRIYLHEAESRLKPLLEYLHDEIKIQGVTVFRGITGFGSSGRYHSSTLLDLSLDLPVVVEFFDDENKVNIVLEHLDGVIKPGHIVCWPGKTNAGDT